MWLRFMEEKQLGCEGLTNAKVFSVKGVRWTMDEQCTQVMKGMCFGVI